MKNSQISPAGPYTDDQALDLLLQYRRNPAGLKCPNCYYQEGTMQILGFIEPHIDDQGYATLKDPEGEYAAAVYCHGCKLAIGLLVGGLDES